MESGKKHTLEERSIKDWLVRFFLSPAWLAENSVRDFIDPYRARNGIGILGWLILIPSAGMMLLVLHILDADDVWWLTIPVAAITFIFILIMKYFRRLAITLYAKIWEIHGIGLISRAEEEVLLHAFKNNEGIIIRDGINSAEVDSLYQKKMIGKKSSKTVDEYRAHDWVAMGMVNYKKLKQEDGYGC